MHGGKSENKREEWPNVLGTKPVIVDEGDEMRQRATAMESNTKLEHELHEPMNESARERAYARKHHLYFVIGKRNKWCKCLWILYMVRQSSTPEKNGHNRLVSVVCLIKCFVNNHWFYVWYELCVCLCVCAIEIGHIAVYVVWSLLFLLRAQTHIHRTYIYIFGDGDSSDDAQFVLSLPNNWSNIESHRVASHKSHYTNRLPWHFTYEMNIHVQSVSVNGRLAIFESMPGRNCHRMVFTSGLCFNIKWCTLL